MTIGVHGGAHRLHSQTMKIRIQFLTKNSALINDAIDMPSCSVPRVGELIEMEHSDYSHPLFIVESVVYKPINGELTPHLCAREWYKGYRFDLLKRRGWLNPDDLELLEYDEDGPTVGF